MIDYKGISMNGLTFIFQVLSPFLLMLYAPKPLPRPIYSYAHLNKLLTNSIQQHIYFIFLCRQNAVNSSMAFFLGKWYSLITCP